VINAVSYRLFITSILPLVLAGFLWTLAVPYFYAFMDKGHVVMEYMDPLADGAEEENVENMNELEKDYKLRLTSPDFSAFTNRNTVYTTSLEVFGDFDFMEIPNPPPESPFAAQVPDVLIS